jgi:hypothetical protein
MGNLPLGTLANDPGEKACLPDLVLVRVDSQTLAADRVARS